MLLVKVRPTAAPVAAALAVRGGGAAAIRGVSAAPAGAAAAAGGIQALAALERNGLIRRIVPLSQRAVSAVAPAARRSPMAMLAAAAVGAAAAGEATADRNAGVSIVELQRPEETERVRAELARDPNVVSAEPVPVRYLVAKARRGGGGGRAATRGARPALKAPRASTMWNLQKIQWAEARALSGFKDATAIKVAVLDSGIDTKHADLDKQIKQYVFSHPDLPDVSGARDLIGHGTHVAGTIAAERNRIGINGICDCALSAWKIFDDVADYDPWSDSFVYFVEPVMYLRALADCVAQGQNVVNLSIGGGGEPDSQEEQLFAELIAGGTVVVAAMGNEREEGSPVSYPAAIPGVIAVGATSIDDSIANFSNAGNHISLCAPGVGIWSTLPRYRGQFGFEALPGHVEGKPFARERYYAPWDGTSMASPHVAGAVALLLANRGMMSPADVRDQLMETADEVSDMTGDFDSDFGAGRLNLLRLLQET
jgi:subtilisin family serine protease